MVWRGPEAEVLSVCEELGRAKRNFRAATLPGLAARTEAVAAIKIEGDRLSKDSLDMTGVEAPPIQETAASLHCV